MVVGQRLRELSQKKGWSIQQIALKSDLPLETVRNIYYGKASDPKISTVMKLSKAFDLSVNCFMGQCQHTAQERVLLQNYRACGLHGKSLIELTARYEAGAAKGEREAAERHRIPCLVPHGDLRAGIVYDNCETVEIETSVPQAYVAIKMSNYDFVPIFCKNDIILFENRFPQDGELGAFFKGDRAYIRKYIEEAGQHRLKCLHNQGEDIVLKRMDEIEYIGTCVGTIRA